MAEYPLKDYRGQKISRAEQETLKQSIGQFKSMKSFFSTTTNYNTARQFLDCFRPTLSVAQIVFEIDDDPKNASRNPFADICKHHALRQEGEILFMFNSIFRLDSIDRSSDSDVGIVRMTLFGENEQDLKEVLKDIKQQSLSRQSGVVELGKELLKIKPFKLAE